MLLFLFIDRFLSPFFVRQMVEKLIKTKSNKGSAVVENPKYGTLQSDDECLTMTSWKGPTLKLRWQEIEEVRAFKRDLFSIDLICLVFKKSGIDEYYEAHEEMAGYHDLLEAMQKHLPKFTLVWMFDVSVPAFKRNERIIWTRIQSEFAIESKH